MLQLTKIFHFEMAHAIYGYIGNCKNIHGHSYKLHVTVKPAIPGQEYIPAPGLILDFKELKHLVNSIIIEKFDHKLLLSENYISAQQDLYPKENLVIWAVEPSAENMLIFIAKSLIEKLPEHIKLAKLKLYETGDSYAEWMDEPSSFYSK